MSHLATNIAGLHSDSTSIGAVVPFWRCACFDGTVCQ